MAASTDEQDRTDMARLTSGQDTALNDLMSRYAERLYHYLFRMLQNEIQAADLTQETFVRVYLHRTRFKRSLKFSTWLYAIATNLARDVRRQAVRHPAISLEGQTDDSGRGFHELLPDQKPNPAELLDTEDRAQTVRRAVASLPEELRTPLILSIYEEKSHAEIAQILECTAKAVETRLYRARHHLRGLLEKSLALS
jgi:RNA polymerase sigma-70 factor (ECF subfamily)